MAGTAALAFRSGGYYEEPRAIAGVAAWVLVAVLALVLPSRRLLPGAPGALAVAGLALLTGWTAITASWAPLPDAAGDDLERLVVYLGVLLAAVLALSQAAARRWLAPGLVLVAVVVVGYGLAERFLPGVFEFDNSPAAAGRLVQPLTYWNAMGALAATGLVLAVRIAADRAQALVAVAAAAAMPLLALGVYLSFSRAALLAAAIGAVTLLVLAPRRAQVTAVIVALAGGAAVALLASRYPAFESLSSSGDAERQGLAMLAFTILLCAASGFAMARARREAQEEAPASRIRRRAVAALAVLVLLVPVLGAPLAFEAGDPPDQGAGASRISSVGSTRYAYWRVALEAVPERPLKGIGAGGFPVLWMKERRIDEAVRDAHSLQLETAAELGLPGLICLAILVAGVVLAAGTALRCGHEAAVGPVAALLALATTVSVDWIWEMPAVALVGLLLSATLLSATAAPPEFEGAG